MAFVRQKQSRGRTAYYLVENYRADSKVKQKVLAYLGECDTVEKAIASFEEEAARVTALAHKFEEKAAGEKAELVRRFEEAVGRHPTLLTYPSFRALSDSLANDIVPRPERRRISTNSSDGYVHAYTRYWDSMDEARRLIARAEAAAKRAERLRSLSLPVGRRSACKGGEIGGSAGTTTAEAI